MHVSRFLFLLALVSFISLSVTENVSAETAVERGDYLVNTIGTCGNCHTPRGGPLKGKPLAGGNSFGGPKAPFTAYSRNITQDKETGIGKWTDAEIIRAIREGKRPDGSTIGPPMPVELYWGVSDTDIKAVVAYLRTVKPVTNKVKKSDYRFPLPKSYGPPVRNVADVPRGNTVRYGAYLAGPMGHCVECHTPQIKGGHFDFANQLGRGGRTFRGPWGKSVSRNLTPHPEDGLGKWSDAEIKRAITTGVSRDNKKLKPPMAYALYKGMTDGDISALITFLRSLKPMADKK